MIQIIHTHIYIDFGVCLLASERAKRARRYLVMFMEVQDIYIQYIRVSVSNTHVRVECFAN